MRMTTIILSLLLSTNISAFTLNNTAAAAFSDSEVKVYFANNCVNSGIDTAEWLYIINQAADRFWNTATTSKLKLVEAGTRSVSTAFYTEALCTNATSDCDINPNLVVSDNILISCNEETTINFPDDRILAKALPNNTSGKVITGAIVLINDRSTNRFQDMATDEKISVVAHEIGHALGLGHSKFKEALMYAESLESRTKLGWDDIEGISFLYPKEQPFGGFCSSVEIDDHNHFGPNAHVHDTKDIKSHNESATSNALISFLSLLLCALFITYKKRSFLN